jgi:universal stress protein E
VNKPTRLLVVLDRSSFDHALLAKAGRLAQRFDARLELFLCDAEHAYALKHDYDSSHGDEVRRGYVARGVEYLTALQAASGLDDGRTSVAAACESPLYEGVVHKVMQSRPDMVLKNANGVYSPAGAAFDANDWQLMRKCPVTLLMSRGRAWHTYPRFAAAVDVSAEETVGLARSIIETSVMLSAAHGSETDVLYSEPGGVAELTKEARAQALRRLAQQCHVDSDAVCILDGNPEHTLPAAVLESHYDVLTLGALTHRPGATALIGTLTSRLVDAVDCDFVLVKPDTSQPAANVGSGVALHSAGRAADSVTQIPQ